MKKIIIISVLILFSSCRTVKKDWLKENYVHKESFEALKINTSNSIEIVENQLYQELATAINTYLKHNSESSSTTENKNVTVSGSIEAEEGKEKSVTVGDTKITSNGASVTFQTNITKVLTKQFEKIIEEQNHKIQSQEVINSLNKSRFDSVSREFRTLKNEISKLKSSKSKEVVKKGFSFGLVITIIVISAIILVMVYFRTKIMFLLKRVKLAIK